MTFEELGIKTKPGQVRYSTTCPQPNCSAQRKKSSQPCLTVNDEPGNRWWNCNHCGWSGNLDTMDKYEEVKNNSRMPENISGIKSYSKDFAKYLTDRGFSTRTLLRQRIFENITRYKHYIGFPFYIHHTLVNVKYYNLKAGPDESRWIQLPKKFGTKSCWWGLDQLQIDYDGNRTKQNVIILTEGEWDRLTWLHCGYINILSPPMGAPNPNAKNFEKEFEYLNDPYFQHVAKYVDIFYIASDKDKPGLFLEGILATNLGKSRCKIINYPPGYKDINDVLKGNNDLPALGPDGVKECYNNAGAFPIKGIIRPSLLKDELEEIRTGGFVPGLKCGIGEIDYLFTIKRKHLSFWTGIPSMGKSSFIRWYIVKLIQNNAEMDMKWALFTPENRPTGREYAMIAQVLTGKTIEKDKWNSMNDELYRKTMNFIEKHFIVVAPDRKNYEDFSGKIKPEKVNTLESLLKYFSYLVKTENIFGYVIDAWNKVSHEIPKGMTGDQYIESQLDLLLDFNDYFDVHGIVIAHPTKLEQNKRSGNFEVPNLYNIKGASAWFERADIGVVAHRILNRGLGEDEKREDDLDYVPRDKSPLIVKCDKLRFQELGHLGRVRLEMNGLGDFKVMKEDEGLHIKAAEKEKKQEEDDKKELAVKLQPVLPEFIDSDEEDKDLPF